MAARELLRRRRIRGSLTEWARHCGYEPAPHHRLIISKLEAVCRGDIQNLLIFAPPGSAKSSYVSVLFPSYYLANHPTHNVLAATHSTDFAQKWGRKVRNETVLHSNTLGISLAPDSMAADRWTLRSGGEYYGVGAGTGISGFRADLGIIDDPFGSREDAFSETVRRKRWEWYLDDYSARLKPTARRVVIHTRWHQEDIAGMMLEQKAQGIIDAEVVSIPAIAEADDALGRKPGEWLWDDPEGYNYAAFLKARHRETSAMMWSALYQQRPVPEEGDYFRAEWLRPYTAIVDPSILRIYGASDYAVTADGGDYTVHIVVGLDPRGQMFLLDIWRKQASSDVWVEAFCDLVERWKPLEWAEEGGQIKAGVGPFLQRRMIERKAFTYRRQFPSKHDKAVRAQSIRGRMAVEGLYIDPRQPWYEPFRSELLTFPAGKHDDQVDGLGLIGQLLDHIEHGDYAAKKPEARTLEDLTLDEMWEMQGRGGARRERV